MLYPLHVAALVIAFGATADVATHSSSVAWPLRAFVTDPHGRTIPFSAVTLGGDLVIRVGGSDNAPVLRPLARGDTVHATTPAQYFLDLEGGPIAFFTDGQDSIRVVVASNRFGDDYRVANQGRRLTVHLEGRQVVIDPQ